VCGLGGCGGIPGWTCRHFFDTNFHAHNSRARRAAMILAPKTPARLDFLQRKAAGKNKKSVSQNQ
jgi:hypothetical protein